MTDPMGGKLNLHVQEQLCSAQEAFQRGVLLEDEPILSHSHASPYHSQIDTSLHPSLSGRSPTLSRCTRTTIPRTIQAIWPLGLTGAAVSMELDPPGSGTPVPNNRLLIPSLLDGCKLSFVCCMQASRRCPRACAKDAQQKRVFYSSSNPNLICFDTTDVGTLDLSLGREESLPIPLQFCSRPPAPDAPNSHQPGNRDRPNHAKD